MPDDVSAGRNDGLTNSSQPAKQQAKHNRIEIGGTNATAGTTSAYRGDDHVAITLTHHQFTPPVSEASARYARPYLPQEGTAPRKKRAKSLKKLHPVILVSLSPHNRAGRVVVVSQITLSRITPVTGASCGKPSWTPDGWCSSIDWSWCSGSSQNVSET